MPVPFARSASQTRPTFSRDFAGLKTLDHGVGPAITFTRGSNATYFNASGTLTTATTNEPRFDHNPSTGASLGLLIEEARTNSIRNSQAGGAVAGTPGTLPTNWETSVPTGITRQVVATGTVGGLAYVDIKFSGTNTSGVSANFFLAAEPATQIVAANGQTWTASVYLALVGGNFTNVTNDRLQLHERNVGGSSIGNTSVGIATVGSTLTRFSATRTFNQATTERTNFQVAGTVADGVAIDLTLRIAAPQLEQGAFPTSYIPTTNAAATRAADSAVVTPISSFYNGTEGTIFNEFSVPVLDGAGTLRGVTTFAEASAVQNRFQSSFRGTGQHVFAAAAANVGEWDITSATGLITAGTTHRLAMGYNMVGNHARSHNGAAVATSSTAGTTPTRERLLLGFNGTAYMQGHIRKIAYWPKRLSNTLLQQLTT